MGVFAIRSALAAAVGALLLASSCRSSGTRGGDVPTAFKQVRENLYVFSGLGSNVGVLATDAGVVLVDDMFAWTTPDLLEQIASVTEQPVRYVINTHHHGDHVGANPYFLDKAVVVGHEKARYKMIEGFVPGPAPVVFREALTLSVGGSRVRAVHMGRGHTAGDVVVHFPDLGVLMTGDLYVNGSGPAVDYDGGGSALAWDDTLANLKQLDYDLVIPGHGEVATAEQVERWRADFRKFRERLKPLALEGLDADEALERVDLSDFERWHMGRPQLKGLPGILEELREAAPRHGFAR